MPKSSNIEGTALFYDDEGIFLGTADVYTVRIESWGERKERTSKSMCNRMT
jgi:hypothetical protein